MNLKHDEKAYVSTSTGQEPSENKITFNLYVASGDSWWCRWFYKNTSVSSLLELFLNTVENYGLPSRVRSDKGKKNVDVARNMLNHPLRGPGRGSMICGHSVRN